MKTHHAARFGQAPAPRFGPRGSGWAGRAGRLAFSPRLFRAAAAFCLGARGFRRAPVLRNAALERSFVTGP
jgi:hypothetical protein